LESGYSILLNLVIEYWLFSLDIKTYIQSLLRVSGYEFRVVFIVVIEHWSFDIGYFEF